MVADTSRRKNPVPVAPLVGAVLLLLAMGGGGYWAWVATRPKIEPFVPLSNELPETTPTRFLNTTDQATYVGTAACAECHAAQFKSYGLTAHSRALAPLDPQAEPADATFLHQASGRRYRIYRQDGQFRQQEYLEDEQGVVVSQDFAIDWLIGSGRHSRSYLVDMEGVLVESPVTWYSHRQAWDVSPGFDQPNHFGFERVADEGCLICHVGQLERAEDGSQVLEIREQAIGCERCHGPGSLHVQRHRQSPAPPLTESGDPTIVNPARLTRELAEDVCAQCHLRGDASVTVRGRRLSDYRPGLPLTDVRVDYHWKVRNRPMKVVGHVEQMRASPCWQAEGSRLTCTTCHDPHQDARPEDKVAFYRAKCLECHAEPDCTLPVESPRRVESRDHCAGCHMPQVDTDIPHIAFTHHRIGIHDPHELPPEPDATAELVPVGDVSQLAEHERNRCLGLAYMEYSEKISDRSAADEYRRRAWELLHDVHARGLHDGDIEAALGRILWEIEPEHAVLSAQATLSAPTSTDQARINALFILSDVDMKRGDFEAALQPLRDLTALRRNAEDHLRLATCHAELEQWDQALEAAQKSLEIQPFRVDTYALMRDVCERAGRTDEAARYAQLHARLSALEKPSEP